MPDEYEMRNKNLELETKLEAARAELERMRKLHSLPSAENNYKELLKAKDAELAEVKRLLQMVTSSDPCQKCGRGVSFDCLGCLLQAKDAEIAGMRAALKEARELMPKPCEHFAFHGAMEELLEDSIRSLAAPGDKPAPKSEGEGKEPPHCPECGYTEEDARIHADHRLCGGKIPSPEGGRP